MKRLALGLMLSTFFACPEPDEPPAPVKPAPVVVALLREVRGAVTLTREGASRPAKDEPVFDGDVLTTGGDGHVTLSGGGREVELLENSRFRVGKTLGDLALDVGELMFLETDAGAFDTALGAARPAAGSRVKMQASDAGTTFEVGFGSLMLFDVPDAGAQTVKAGEKFVVGMGVLSLEEPVLPVKPPPEVKPTLKLTSRGGVSLKGKKLAGPRELDENGAFIVDRAGQLTVEAGGARAQLQASSKGTIEPSSGDTRFKLALREGSARIFLKEGESVLVDGRKPLKLTARTSSTVVVTATKSGAPRVEVLGGAVDSTVGETTTALQPRKGAPVLSLPAARSSRVNWARPGDVALLLTEGDGEVEVAADAEFQNVLIAAKTVESLVVPAPLKGGLFWRRAGDAEPGQARFERDEYAGAIAAKSDTVAETGLKATVYFQGAVPTLTFTFPVKSDAASWRFRVYSAGNLKTALVDRKVTENKAVVESGALAEGSYLWSAVPTSSSGVEASGGRMNKMDIVFDNSVTRLVLTSPKDGERAAKAIGVAPLGSKLSLNGKPVPLDAGGRFSLATPPGNVAVFKLVTRDGAESFWVRRLTR